MRTTRLAEYARAGAPRTSGLFGFAHDLAQKPVPTLR
jgi:hypothetical protein